MLLFSQALFYTLSFGRVIRAVAGPKRVKMAFREPIIARFKTQVNA